MSLQEIIDVPAELPRAVLDAALSNGLALDGLLDAARVGVRMEVVRNAIETLAGVETEPFNRVINDAEAAWLTSLGLEMDADLTAAFEADVADILES